MAAYALEREGFRPVVFGRSEEAASRAAQGVLCNKGMIFWNSPLFRAKLLSLQEMKEFLDRFERESGRTLPRIFQGVKEPFWTPDDFQATVSRIYRHKFWGCHRTSLVPFPASFPERASQPLGELFYPADGWFEPESLLSALEGYLRDRGILFVADRVQGFSSDREDRILLSLKGQPYPGAFDRVVLASGAGSEELWRLAGLKPIPLFTIGGQTLWNSRPPEESSQILVKGTHSLALTHGRMILGSSSWQGFEPPSLEDDQNELLTFGRTAFGLKALDGWRTRRGVRLRCKDRMPLVGYAESGPFAGKIYIFTGFYKNGMHLAEMCGRELALDLCNKGAEKRFPEFSPRRFSV